MHPKISVIVPIYKAEKYIHRCINSILAQTFNDFELILVNDGSPDNCGAICDEYAARDSRIKVIHKKNGGVASARQCGIDHASGIYTIHADPDDWIEPNMLEELYNIAIENKADMVICDFYIDTKEQCIYQRQEPSSLNSDDVLKSLLFHKLHGSLCNKLIKRSCYTKEPRISFVKDLNYCEDYIVCVKILMNNIKVEYLNQAFYHYDQVVNNDSITRKYTLNTYKQRCMFINELKKVLKDKYQRGTRKNEALVAVECLHYGVLSKKEFKKIYYKRKWDLFKSINGLRGKIRFMKECLF